MGIYTTLLEEDQAFMGNTDFDDDMIDGRDPEDKGVDLKGISDIIDDINQDYADQSSQEELDGQDMTSNPVEECMIAMYESEHNWNQIMQHLGTRDLTESARGRELVLEAVDIKGFINSAKQFFEKMFVRITSIVKKWLDNAFAVVRFNKKFAAKYGSKMKDYQAAYEAKSNKKEFKGYPFFTARGTKESLTNTMNAIKKENEAAKTKANKMLRDINAGTAIKADEKDYDDIVNSARGVFTTGGSVSAEDFSDALKTTYYGSTEKVTLKDENVAASNIVACLSSDDAIKEVRKLYNEVKKSFNDTIKALNELQRALGKTEKGKYDEDTANHMSAVTRWISAEKQGKNIAHQAYTTFMRARKAKLAQCRKIANAYVFAGNAETRKDKMSKFDKSPKTESAGFFNNLELI